jgi:hypothetical protein
VEIMAVSMPEFMVAAVQAMHWGIGIGIRPV